MRTAEQGFDLRGKTAVVIGGAGHLCSVLAGAMQGRGMKVAVLDPLPPGRVPGDRRAGELYLQCDVTSKPRLAQCRERILRRFGRVDVLLNGAGANAPTPFFKITPQEIRRIMGAHVEGLIYSCQVFGETMLRQRSGSIINFASVSAGPPLSKAFVYSAAKSGVVSLTQNLAREWAPYNVRVNALKPGFFPTEWSMKHFIDKGRKADIFRHTPMRRFGRPEELVGAVLWLASDSAGFVTGSVVTVDGGFTAMTL